MPRQHRLLALRLGSGDHTAMCMYTSLDIQMLSAALQGTMASTTACGQSIYLEQLQAAYSNSARKLPGMGKQASCSGTGLGYLMGLCLA